MASLLSLKGPDAGRRYELTEGRIVLGRHPNCDIVLDQGAVSRQHAQITTKGDQCRVEDLHSRNGTFVNDEALVGQRLLAEGDELRICDLLYGFSLDLPGSSKTMSVGDESSLAMWVDDRDTTGSKIMSKLEVSSESSRIVFQQNPEVQLRAVVEITQNLSKSLSLDEVLPKVLDSLFKIFLQANRGFVVLRTGPQGALIPKAVKFRREDQDDTIRISRTIVDEVMEKREAILSADATSDSRFDMSQSVADSRIRSMICAPLLDSEGNAQGVIQLDTMDQRSRFKEQDLELLAGVAAPAGLAIENAQLHEDVLRQQAVERDLEMARRVQQGLLPAAPPKVEGYDFFDFYEPAKHVGGDMYDYVWLADGRIGICVADVSGKGVAAALLMAKLTAEWRYCLASESEVDAAIRLLNARFASGEWEDRFVTMIVAVLDPATGEVTIVNAGHLPPLVRREGKAAELSEDESDGLPLGVTDEYPYAAYSLCLEPGDSIAFYTDGFSEAMNPAGDLYGMERLRERFSDPAADAAELGRHLLVDVQQFIEGQAQSDDMCLVCVGRSAI